MNEQVGFDRIEAEQNATRVKELQARVERQAQIITRLEESRKVLKKQNKRLRERLGEANADTATWESLGRGIVDFPEPDQSYGAAD